MDQATLTNMLLGAIGFLIVYTLNGIKTEITEVKKSMNELSKELVKIDNRVTIIEEHHRHEHSH